MIFSFFLLMHYIATFYSGCMLQLKTHIQKSVKFCHNFTQICSRFSKQRIAVACKNANVWYSDSECMSPLYQSNNMVINLVIKLSH